jgi:hypothetical protein
VVEHVIVPGGPKDDRSSRTDAWRTDESAVETSDGPENENSDRRRRCGEARYRGPVEGEEEEEEGCS